jgi:hypothetical protein
LPSATLDPAEVALIDRMASFRHDPLGHVLYVYPWGVKGTALEHKTGPRKWQARKLKRIGEKLRAGRKSANQVIQEATVSGHGVGKSALVAFLVKWGLDTLLDTKCVVTANTEKQLQTKTWPEIAKWHYLSLTKHWFTFTATSLYSVDPEHEKTWRADAIPWSENNTEAFAGLHNIGRRIIAIFDEASKIADKVWEVTEGALTDLKTEIIWAVFGNGTRATGRFRECYRKFRHRWDGEHIDSRDVEDTNKELLAQWVADYGEESDFVKVRVLGQFPNASIKSLISEADVDPAYGRHLRDEQYNWAPIILSCDPAWEGDDMLVIGLRQGLMFKILVEMPKNDNDVWVANKLARLEDEHHADAVFIDAGYGTGIKSAGDVMGRTWTLVWFGEKADDPGYVNKRSEMWGAGIKPWLKAGGAIEKRPQLREDLLGPETVARLDGKILLESKDSMKKRGIPSPNYGDALGLTFAHPVMKRDSQLVGAGGRGMVSDYDHRLSA